MLIIKDWYQLKRRAGIFIYGYTKDRNVFIEPKTTNAHVSRREQADIPLDLILDDCGL